MGFFTPVNLLYALSIAVLVAIYLRARTRTMLAVSSLILFEKAPAPASRIKRLRLDLLFWLEAALLAALTLALGGLFVQTKPLAPHGPTRALVFDLGAAMGAREGKGTRLDLAKRSALGLVAAAPGRERFSLIGYALEARLIHPDSARRESIKAAIAAMHPKAVAASRAALAAALIRARGAGEIDLFASHPPPDSVLREVRIRSPLHYHQIGSPADNLAIVSLDPGIPRTTPGRVVLRNFSTAVRQCEVAIECAGKRAFAQTFVLGPREQIVARFGPLLWGGLVHARILTDDALAADNDRYAYAPTRHVASAIVLSPDADVRDDLARVLLAVNSNFAVTALEPSNLKPANVAGKRFELALMHDCYVPTVNAGALLLVYPQLGAAGPGLLPGGLHIEGTLARSTMRAGESGQGPAELGSTRRVALPQWMTPTASGSAPGVSGELPLAALGTSGTARIGLLAFDVRGHLLLDPDRLEALIATVDLVRELTVPPNLRIVSAGVSLDLPSPGAARIEKPDGSTATLAPDAWGRVRIRPLQAGHYRVSSGGAAVDIYANYFDASESDLSAGVSTGASRTGHATQFLTSDVPVRQAKPLTVFLIAVALLALLAESALLSNRAARYGKDHV